MNSRFLLIHLFIFSYLSLNAQISQSMINKAKEAGFSDQEIQQELKKVNNQTGARDISDNHVNVTDEARVSRVIDAESHKITPSSEEIDTRNMVFGREIFRNNKLTFAPDLNIPTPKEYKLAAGDELIIHVWGDSKMNLRHVITPEGVIHIDNLGPIFLSGLTIEEAEKVIKQELGQIMSTITTDGNANTLVSVTLGKIRSIQINIVGETSNPGTYTISSFATLFNALYIAGGVNKIGSLRSIKVFRNNKLVTNLDVYDFLLNGQYNTDIRLENNDMILVSPYEQLVSIKGHVKRNRTFELKKGETLGQVIEMAGGFLGDAYKEEILVKRVVSDGYRVFTLTPDLFASFVMYDGDEISVNGAIPLYENRLRIEGAVWRPGEYELTDEVNTVKKLISKARGLKGDEFTGRAHITRLNEDFTTTLIALDIEEIINGNSPDYKLQKEDLLNIPSIFDLRESYYVKIGGAVNNPKIISFKKNMTVEDAIVLAGGLKESASHINVEIARRIKNPLSSVSTNRIAEVFNISISEDLKIPIGEEIFILEPFDEILIKYSPEYSNQQVVKVHGEITFNGQYVLSKKNSRLSDIVKKAGGVTTDAYVRGANLKRKVSTDDLRRLETLLGMSTNESGRDSIPVQSIDLSNYTVGINLEKALRKPGSSDDLILQDGDELYIPQFKNTVKITGAVYNPNSITYSDKLTIKDCLSQSGGYNDIARKLPIVIYMNGMVATTKRTGIFFKKYPPIEPGCEVVIPSRTLTDRKLSPIEIMSIASSTTSMAAMVTSLINSIK